MTYRFFEREFDNEVGIILRDGLDVGSVYWIGTYSAVIQDDGWKGSGKGDTPELAMAAAVNDLHEIPPCSILYRQRARCRSR